MKRGLNTRSQFIGKKEIKVLLVGSQQVGKSSLASRFILGNESSQFHDEEETHSKLIKIEDETLRVSITDNVGKQSFYSSDNPYKIYDVIMILFDITDLKVCDFNEIKNLN